MEKKRNLLVTLSALSSVFVGVACSAGDDAASGRESAEVAPAAREAVAAAPAGAVAQATGDDLRRILQRVIDLPELDGYYHVSERPDRKPLRVVLDRSMPTGVAVTKFGEPVVFLTPQLADTTRPYLAILRLDVSGDSGYVEFSYPAEGLLGSVTLSRQDTAWLVSESRLVERSDRS